MSIEPDRDQFFQYATFGVLGLTLVVCLCYGLIFINPRANFITALQPSLPSPTVAGLVLPATWTPTATDRPTSTATATLTETPTLVPTDTPEPTDTTVPSSTPRPTARPATPRPPAPPPGPKPTRVPPTAVPPPPSPLFRFATYKQGCFHSGQTFVEGTVYLDSSGGSTKNGAHVRLSYAPGGPAVVNDDISGSHGGRAGYYILFINASGPKAGNWFVWLVDTNGNALSDPQAGNFSTNNLGSGNPAACWRQVVDFVRR